MEHSVRSISKELQIQIENILNNSYIDAPLFEKAESIKNALLNCVSSISNSAKQSMDETYQESKEYRQFIDTYCDSLVDWKMQVYVVLEKINNEYHSFNRNFIQEFMQICNQEIQFVFKNLQYIIIQEKQIPVKFISHHSACEVCKFAEQNEFVNKDFLSYDTCDSYFVKQTDMLETDNLISNDIRMYNVPKKFKKQIASFYKIVHLKYKDYIKNNVKIKFVQEFDFGEKYKNIIDCMQFCYDSETETNYIKFEPNSFQYYILKSILKTGNNYDEVKEIYYSKTSKDVILSDVKFINFLAGQSAEDYYYETLISYILNPEKLESIDKEIYNFWYTEIERV